MSFEDIVAVLGQAFGMELKVVQDTTVFEVASDDGSAKVQILLQDAGERNLVLLSADLGEVPPEGRERLFQTMLEANNMFSGTVGSTLALDAASGNARLQRYMPGDDLANNVMGTLEPFIETALLWSRMIADYRPSVDVPMEFTELPGGDGPGLMSVFPFRRFGVRGGWLYQPRGQRCRGMARQAHPAGGHPGRGRYHERLPTGDQRLRPCSFPAVQPCRCADKRLPALDLSGVRAAALKAAESRLDDAIAHAKKLNAEGKVYKQEDWQDAGKRKAMKPLDKEVTVTKKDGTVLTPPLTKPYVTSYRVNSCPSYYRRDYIAGMFPHGK